jgi:hypothetical protein
VLDDRDEELESLVSGVSGRTESSALSVSGVSVASSRVSTSSTLSTASSLFSVDIEQHHEMTRDEKNIAKALKRNQLQLLLSGPTPPPPSTITCHNSLALIEHFNEL